MAKKPTTIPEERLNLYNDLIASFPEIERKGKTMPYTSVNGHMFSFLGKQGNLSMRFDKKEQEAFMEKHNATHSIQHGSVMNGYVLMPTALLSNVGLMKESLKKSYEFAKSLKPKPSKKKK